MAKQPQINKAAKLGYQYCSSRYYSKPNFRYHTERVVLPAMAEMFPYSAFKDIPIVARVLFEIPLLNRRLIPDVTTLYAAIAAVRLLTAATPLVRERHVKEPRSRARKRLRLSGVAAVVTKDKMYGLLEKLAHKALPSRKSFAGLKDSFDHRGRFYNYSFFLNSLAGFDETEYEAEAFAKIKQARVTVHTTATTYLEAVQLLRLYQLPIVHFDNAVSDSKRSKKFMDA